MTIQADAPRGRAAAARTAPAGVPALVLPQERRQVLSAVLRDEHTAVCGRVKAVSLRPITALCRSLLAAGRPDRAMQVRDGDGRAVCFVDSIHQVARSARA